MPIQFLTNFKGAIDQVQIDFPNAGIIQFLKSNIQLKNNSEISLNVFCVNFSIKILFQKREPKQNFIL
jgi:hypothetical protein